MGKMDGKVVLITGAGSGIGRATAILFGQEGAKVVVSDIVTEGGEGTVKIITDAGGDAVFIRADIALNADVEAAVGQAVSSFGRLDCAVNNAGMEAMPTPTADCAETDFDKTIEVNLKGTWLCMKYELQQMLKQGSGAIVNVSSVAGLVGVAAMPAYVAAKHGILGLTKTAALEYGNAGIRVNAVCPSAVKTPMMEQIIASMPDLAANMNENHPVGRIGETIEIAESILWLSSDASSFVTGHALAVDGGFLVK